MDFGLWDRILPLLPLEAEDPFAMTLLAFGLGFASGAGLLAAIFTSKTGLGIFFFLLGIYHLLEFSFVARHHKDKLSAHSFLVDHSDAWLLAWTFCFVEYLVGMRFFPNFKSSPFFVVVGTAVTVFGQVVRSGAMFGIGQNFNHHVEDRGRSDHVLCTSGLYAFVRHPSYLGWTLWAVGMPLIVGNLLSVPVFALGAYMFFADRIPDEEEKLIGMFGKDYIEYIKKVPCGLPFIKSRKVHDE